MERSIKLLVVEDSEDDEDILLRTLRKGGLEVAHVRVETEAALRGALGAQRWDMVISDYSMPHFDGFSAFKVVRSLEPDLPFIFVSGQLGEDTAVEAMRLGASDYLTKGKLGRLVPAVRRELGKVEELHRRREAESALERTERQLQQAQKMEALGRLAGGVAHDFNNLLTVIQGHLALMVESPDNAGMRREGLEQIRSCADRAAALTRQLLALGRRQPQQARAVDLNRLVEDLGRMLGRVIGEDVRVSFELSPGLAPVLADPGQLEQILLNLAINARDAMPGGGLLAIGTGELRLDEAALAGNGEARPGRFAGFWVRDNGTGMDAELMSRIFEPFFTTKPEGQGTGLGLSSVYGIVRQNRGHISVRSAPGQGSEFRVYLPFAEPQAAPPPAGPAAAAAPGTETILVVEDVPELRRLVRVSLGRQGYRVLEAEDPEHALKLAAEHPVHLLLTDVTMPGMDGRELARRVRGLKPSLKVLFMTGYAMEDDQVVLDADFLAKPFTPTGLWSKVREVLGGS